MERIRFRRLGLAAAAAATALTGLCIAPGGAAATAQNRCHLDGWMSSGNGIVEAWLYRECVNPESYIPLDLTVQRYDSAAGIWINVASGRGHAVYRCVGTSQNYFHQTALSSDYLLANCF